MPLLASGAPSTGYNSTHRLQQSLRRLREVDDRTLLNSAAFPLASTKNPAARQKNFQA
jgi:hypothetical protein